jgi:hypothetical protein
LIDASLYEEVIPIVNISVTKAVREWNKKVFGTLFRGKGRTLARIVKAFRKALGRDHMRHIASKLCMIYIYA